MGACLNGMVCIRSAREETHSCGVLQPGRCASGLFLRFAFWLLYLYAPHWVWKWNSIIVYTGSASHLDSPSLSCLLTKRAPRLTIQKKSDRSGRNLNTKRIFFFDSPPPLVASLFLRVAIISFSSAVPVASNFFFSDTPNSDECGSTVLLELPFFLW
jgi:hypothetical protein